MAKQFKYILISFCLVVIQTQVMRLLSLEGITPDILLIWIVYIAVRHGQLQGTIWGFILGLTFDLLTGNFIGLTALTKTLCGFFAGYFYNENKTQLTLGSYRFLIIVLAASLIHNTVYFVLFTRGSDISIVRAVLEFGFATALYTSTLTLIPMLGFARKLAR